MTYANIVGKMSMKIKRQSILQMAMHILDLALGPTNCIYNYEYKGSTKVVHGLRLNLNRPTGGGHHGLWLGSLRPVPTGF